MDQLYAKTNGGSGQNAKYYFFNRPGFYEMCMVANTPKAQMCRGYFIVVYETVLQYITQSRYRTVQKLRNVNKTLPTIEERVVQRTNDKVGRFNAVKIHRELEETKELAEKLTKELEKFRSDKVQQDRIVTEMSKKIHDLNYTILQKEEDIEEMCILNAEVEGDRMEVEGKLERAKRDSEEKVLQMSQELEKLREQYENGARVKTKYNELVRKYNALVKKLHKEDAKDPTKVVDVKPKPSAKPVETTPKYTKTQLLTRTVADLKDICKSSGVGGYSGKTKPELVEWMLKNKKIQY